MTVMNAEQIERFLDDVFPQRMGRIQSVGEMRATMRLKINARAPAPCARAFPAPP